MSIYQTALHDRKIIAVSGPDRVDFLQNLITQNVDGPGAGSCLMAALLTPQGKLLYEFFVYVETDSLLLDVDAEIAEALVKKLSLYKLRADIHVGATDMTVTAIWQEDGFPCPPMAGFFEDPRHEGLGLRGAFTTAPETKLPAKPLADWHKNRLARAVPQGAAEMPPGTVFPLEYGFAHMQAIDFKKGCFVGQEVTSRTHRKGSLRKKLRAFTVAGTHAEAGDPLMAGARSGGQLVALQDGYGLALIREDAKTEALSLNGLDVTLIDTLFDEDA